MYCCNSSAPAGVQMNHGKFYSACFCSGFAFAGKNFFAAFFVGKNLHDKQEL